MKIVETWKRLGFWNELYENSSVENENIQVTTSGQVIWTILFLLDSQWNAEFQLLNVLTTSCQLEAKQNYIKFLLAHFCCSIFFYLVVIALKWEIKIQQNFHSFHFKTQLFYLEEIQWDKRNWYNCFFSFHFEEEKQLSRPLCLL